MGEYTGKCWNIETTADTEIFGFLVSDNIELFGRVENIMAKMSQKVKKNFPDNIKSQLSENCSLEAECSVSVATTGGDVLGLTLDVTVISEYSELRWYFLWGSDVSKKHGECFPDNKNPNRWWYNVHSGYVVKGRGVMTLKEGIKRMKRRDAAAERMRKM